MSTSRDTRTQRALARLGRSIHQRPWLVLGALLLSLAPAGWLASGLTVRSSFLELLPPDRPAVRQLEDVLARAEVTTSLIVAIPNDDPERARRFASDLARALRDEPVVRGVDARLDVEFFADRRLLYVEEARLSEIAAEVQRAVDDEVMRRSGFDLGLDDAPAPGAEALLARVSEASVPLEPWTVTRDGRWLCAFVVFSGPAADLEFARLAQDAVSRGVRSLTERPEHAGLEVRYVGGIAQRLADHGAMTRDLALAGAVGLAAVVLLILVTMRSARALVLLAVPLLIGLAWTFAFARASVGHLNMISGFLFSILSGLGVEYGIHLHHRLGELRAEGSSLEDAIERLLATTGRTLLGIGATNASVFLISALADFSGFHEFGRIAAAGMLLTLASTLLGFPALAVILERRWPSRAAAPEPGAPEDGGVRIPLLARWAVILLVPLFALGSASAVHAGAVRFEGDWRALQGDSDDSRFGEHLRAQLEGTYQNAVVWVRDRDDARAVTQALAAAREDRARRALEWDVVAVQSLEDVVPPAEAQAERLRAIAALRQQLLRIDPSTLASDARRAQLADALRWTEARPFTIDDVPEPFVRAFRTAGDEGTLVLLRTARTYRETTDIIGWAHQVESVRADLERRGVEASIMSENWVAGEIFETIFHDGPWLLGGTLLAVFLVLLLDLRSVRGALLVLGSVLVGLSGLAGAMALTGVDLNFMNAGILPVCVGISLDNALHVYGRYREEGREGIPAILRRTSVANLVSSLTNLVGFGALIVAQHRGLRSVAHLAILGVALTYVSTSIFFPLALQTFGRVRGRAREDGTA